MKPQAYVDVESFIHATDPCTIGRLFLRRYATVRDAWLAKDADPENMLWALCHNPQISDAKLKAIIMALQVAGLTDSLHGIQITFRRLIWTRYSSLPRLSVISVNSPVAGIWRRSPTEKEQKKQRRMLRHLAPDAFCITTRKFNAGYRARS